MYKYIGITGPVYGTNYCIYVKEDLKYWGYCNSHPGCKKDREGISLNRVPIRNGKVDLDEYNRPFKKDAEPMINDYLKKMQDISISPNSR